MASSRPAFSLVELLTVLGIIMFLIGLAIPALRAGRDRARAVGVLSDLRGIGVVVEMYTHAHDNHFPFVPLGAPFVFPPGEDGMLSTNDPWVARYAWPTVMHDIAPWSEHYLTWLRPAARHDGPEPWRPASGSFPLWPSYEYSNSFIASSRVWTPGGAPTLADITPRRATALAFPSLKALMFDRDPDRPAIRSSDMDDRKPVLTADGAAATRRDSEAIAPFPNPLRSDSAWLYHDTPGGLQGRDFR